jgi:hypothetical protein
LAIAAIAVCQIAPWLKSSLVLVTAFSLASALKSNAVRLGLNAVIAITLREDAGVELSYRDGRSLITQIDPASTIWPWLITLHLRCERKRIFLLLLPDMLGTESWRRLSMHLRSGESRIT